MGIPITYETIGGIMHDLRVGIEVLEKLAGVELPSSLKKALENDWLGATDDVALAIMSPLDKEIASTWKKRVVPLRSALNVMAAMEDAVVESIVHESRSILQITLGTFVRQWQYSTTALIAFGGIVVPALFKIGEELGTWLDAEVRLQLAFINQDRDEAREQILRGQEAKDFPLLLATAIFGMIAAVSLRALAGPLASTAEFRTGVSPALKIRDSSMRVIQKRALPQGKRSGARRRKRSR